MSSDINMSLFILGRLFTQTIPYPIVWKRFKILPHTAYHYSPIFVFYLPFVFVIKMALLSSC